MRSIDQRVARSARPARTPSHASTDGFGSGSSVDRSTYVSRPYGGVTRKALVAPSGISGGAGARIGKRF